MCADVGIGLWAFSYQSSVEFVLLLAPAANKQLQSSEKFVSGSRGLNFACAVDSNGQVKILDLCTTTQSWDQMELRHSNIHEEIGLIIHFPKFYNKARSLDIELEDCYLRGLDFADNHAINKCSCLQCWAMTKELLDNPTLITEPLWHSVVIFFVEEALKKSQLIYQEIVVFNT